MQRKRRRTGEKWYPKYEPVGEPGQFALPVDFLASERHFVDHLAPVWLAMQRLKANQAGRFYVPPRLVAHARDRGIQVTRLDPGRDVPGMGTVVVAAYRDLKLASAYQRPVILFEHGCGYTYSSKHTSYAGGAGFRKLVNLFVCPNRYAADANRRMFSQAPVAIVGCPKLDPWHNADMGPRGDPPVVAVSFHWDARIAPESRWAWPYFREAIPELARAYQVLGHGHPRAMKQLRPAYERWGIEVVEDFGRVLAEADLYVCDCSSTIYEFASTDRPVVVLNAPWYRRQVNHGLRFWEHADVGVQCDDPADLLQAVEQALVDPPEQQARRHRATEDVFPIRGNAADTAARVILEFVDKHSAGVTVEPPRRRITRHRVGHKPPTAKRPGKGDPVFPAVKKATAIPGLMTGEEMQVLARLALSARRIVELGVYKGRSLAVMGLVNPEAALCGIDLFEKGPKGLDGADVEMAAAHLVSVGVRGAKIIDASTEAAAERVPGPIDFLHVDAGHSHDEVRRDIALWVPKIAPGGAVAFHDYGKHPKPELDRPGVTETVDAWRNEGWAEVERAGRMIAFRHLVARRGILIVAYGDKARRRVILGIQAIRRVAPTLPVAVVSDEALGCGEIHIWHRDVHAGARSQKTRMYSLSPFYETLYLDADTELLQDPVPVFDLLSAASMDMVMGADMVGLVSRISWPHLDPGERVSTDEQLPTSELIYYNSGVICFRRSEANRVLFQAWHQEWLRWQQQDQLALARAFYAHPVRVATMRPGFNTHKRAQAEFVFHDHHAVRRGDAPK